MPRNKSKILIVFGTRPEAIKMAPLVLELKKRAAFESELCVTGQHKEMLDQVLAAFDIVPDYDLSIMRDGQTLFDITKNVLTGMSAVLKQSQPDIVLVHGDTTTAFASALSCFYTRIPIGHVEAGLRTKNIFSPYPEEFNREAISLLAQFNFAPTDLAKSNLIKEGHDPRTIFVTGNTGIDATAASTSQKPCCCR